CLETASECFFFHNDCLIHIYVKTFVDCFLACADCDRSVLCNLCCHFLCCIHQLSLWIYSVYKTDSVSFICFDIEGCVNHFFRFCSAYKTSQSLCSAESRSNAQTNLRLSENCVVRAESDITAHGNLASSAESKSVYCSNDRDWEC